MMNEAQKNLVACYEELAITRAAANVALLGVAATCREYGIEDAVLAAVDERARRLVMKALPGIVSNRLSVIDRLSASKEL